MLLDGDKNLSGHVATLLGSWSLILNVDTSGTLLNEELGQFHGGGETTVAGVSVSNDGSHIIDDGSRGKFSVREMSASLPLFPVVEELSGEQVLDLVWDCVVGVI